MNDFKDMEKLLKRYWECDTTVGEESFLRAFFLQHDNLPPALAQYKALFIYQQTQQQETLPADFEERLMNKLHAESSKHRFPVWLRIAASLTLLIVIGISVYQYQVQKHQEELAQAQARETVIDAICLISENLQQGEQVIDDALKQFNLLPGNDSIKINTIKL